MKLTNWKAKRASDSITVTGLDVKGVETKLTKIAYIAPNKAGQVIGHALDGKRHTLAAGEKANG